MHKILVCALALATLVAPTAAHADTVFSCTAYNGDVSLVTFFNKTVRLPWP
jgi:hypothetical protein